LIKAKEHDLSHAVFYHQNGYSLICPRRRLDCKNAVYIPPQGEKAANSEEGIDREFAADFLLGSDKTSIVECFLLLFKTALVPTYPKSVED